MTRSDSGVFSFGQWGGHASALISNTKASAEQSMGCRPVLSFRRGNETSALSVRYNLAKVTVRRWQASLCLSTDSEKVFFFFISTDKKTFSVSVVFPYLFSSVSVFHLSIRGLYCEVVYSYWTV